MAALRKSVGVLAATSMLSLACSKPVGLGGTVTPLVQIHVQVTGPLPPEVAGDTANLHVALVWGLQWQPEPFCVLQAFQPESPTVAAVVAAGCPDNFGFMPNLVGADTQFQPGIPATLALNGLPSADVMVGDLNGRIAYGSLVVYDDVNQNGILDLRTPPRFRRRGNQPAASDDGGVAGPVDRVFGASFISMTRPDTRVAYREGAFDETVAFYPRQGCLDDPAAGFSILSTGGFNADTLLGALAAGQLPLAGDFPKEDPATCATAAVSSPVAVQTQPSGNLTQMACTARDSGGVTAYRVAPNNGPDTTVHKCACASFPVLGGYDAGVPTGKQVVCASAPSEACRYVAHYTLLGCDNDPSCATGGWDITATPPAWWKTVCPEWP